jgi:uncharacterized membrane protein
MKAFLIKLPILSAIAIIVTEVFLKEEPFVIKGLLLGIPCAIAGYVVGWGINWVLIHLMGARTNDWKDKLFSIVLPFLVSGGAYLAGASFFN